jgi:hypothetical protein
MLCDMSEITTSAEPAAPQQRRVTGRPFPKGVSGNPHGRAKGSRNRLADAFVGDLVHAWSEYGETALARCAQEEPATFVKVIASLMPKTLDLNVMINPADFASRFEQAAELLGLQLGQSHPRKALPGRTINHADGG